MPHGIGQLVTADVDVADGLAFHLFAVDFQWHGHRAEIFRLAQCVESALFAHVGELIPHFVAGIGVQRTRCLAQTLVTAQVDQLLGDHDGQADSPCQIAGCLKVRAEHRFDQDVAHHHRRQRHGLKGLGRGGRHHVRSLHIHGFARLT